MSRVRKRTYQGAQDADASQAPIVTIVMLVLEMECGLLTACK